MIFFNFFNFVAIFLEFSIMRRVGTELNDNYYFLSFSAFCKILAWKDAIMVFFNFFNFLLFFWNFLFRVRNGTARQFLFSLIFCLSQSILAWKEALMVFLNFFNFLLFFWNFLFRAEQGWNRTLIFFLIFSILLLFFLEFSITRWVGTERNDNLYFLSFSALPNQFWLEKTP